MRSGFFNSEITGYDSENMPVFDRAEDAEFFAKFFKSFLTNGVYPNPSTNFQVKAGISGMTTIVNPGIALIEGYFAWESDQRTMEHQASHATLDRIDRVVLRLNLETRLIDLYVLTGTPAPTPVAPALTRPATGEGGDIYELGLADVFIPKTTTSIDQERITDTRLNDELCGLVTQFVTEIQTSAYYDQLNAMLDNYRQQFLSWFDDIQDILDENAAGNLLNQINLVKSYMPVDHLDITVTPSAFTEQVSNILVPNYPFMGQIPVAGVLEQDVCELWPDQATVELGILSVEVASYNGGVYIFASERPSQNLFFRRLIQRKENIYAANR